MSSNQDSSSGPRNAIEFKCRCCGKTASICRSCWRNQRYCSDECRVKGQRVRKTRNQKKYRASKAGTEAHRLAQQRYRLQ